ncbi:MAG: hypothetical protein ABF446_11425 [Acetobacter orientalis]|uniref:hypothetical protein n=1 Tax=Acetobacter orientalis TaxID=146474 RepID=UPI0039E7FDCF
MRFLGWQGEETTGFSHKTDASGNTIARAHDDEWERDYEAAQAAEDRMLAYERKAP